MDTSSTPSHKTDQDATQVPIERAFLKIFQTVRRKLKFVSGPGEDLKGHMLEALIQAATSKCVEFNIAANRKITHTEMPFFLMSTLRGICEDLIWLTYLARMEKRKAEELIEHMIQRGTLEGLSAQRRFFEANNPTQPVLGNDRNADDEIQSARNKLREFWQSIQIQRRDGPTVRDIAEDVGLTSTYEFTYFSASNFVHFNPNALLRTGWRPEAGPFTFSIRHMTNYYRSFSSFYGAVLFVGFQASFGTDYFKHTLDTQVDRLIELIGHVHRWPEVITFEEMNVRPPLYLLTHALGKVMREEDKTIPHAAILQEVQGLKWTQGTS